MNVIKPHTRSFESFPNAEVGETVVFLRHDEKNPGWFFGRDRRGIEGYFPSGWFRQTESGAEAFALRAYDATELTIAVGDQGDVEEAYGEWLLVRLADARGWIPRSCLELSEEARQAPL